MKHSHGITVALRHDKGTVVKEYDNGTGNDPHVDFDGAIITRRVAISGGSAVEVSIAFDECFKLHSARGVAVEIYFGSGISPLRTKDTGQCWYIPGSKIRSQKTFTFTFFTTFEDSTPSAFFPFAMPDPDEGRYANASHKWVDGSRLCKASLVVYVARIKWCGVREYERTVMEPRELPAGIHHQNPKTPMIIHNEWVRTLASQNGVPYIFEFRNMGKGGISATEVELDHGVACDSLDDLLVSDAESDTGSELSELSSIAVVEDGAADIDEESSSGEEEFHTAFEDNDTDSKMSSIVESESEREDLRPRKSRRTKSQARRSIRLMQQAPKAHGNRRRSRKQKPCEAERKKGCCPEDLDDEEELPPSQQRSIKPEQELATKESKSRRKKSAFSKAQSEIETPASAVSPNGTASNQTDETFTSSSMPQSQASESSKATTSTRATQPPVQSRMTPHTDLHRNASAEPGKTAGRRKKPANGEGSVSYAETVKTSGRVRKQVEKFGAGDWSFATPEELGFIDVVGEDDEEFRASGGKKATPARRGKTKPRTPSKPKKVPADSTAENTAPHKQAPAAIEQEGTKKRKTETEQTVPAPKKPRVDIDLTLIDDEPVVIKQEEREEEEKEQPQQPKPQVGTLNQNEEYTYELEQIQRRKQMLALEMEEADLKRKIAANRTRGKMGG